MGRMRRFGKEHLHEGHVDFDRVLRFVGGRIEPGRRPSGRERARGDGVDGRVPERRAEGGARVDRHHVHPGPRVRGAEQHHQLRAQVLACANASASDLSRVDVARVRRHDGDRGLDAGRPSASLGKQRLDGPPRGVGIVRVEAAGDGGPAERPEAPSAARDRVKNSGRAMSCPLWGGAADSVLQCTPAGVASGSLDYDAGMTLDTVPLHIPEGANVIVGQSHFIKTVEDVYEAIATTAPQMKFGIAFNEASGPCLTRVDGNDEDMKAAAVRNATALAAGHVFVVVLRDGFPINVLNRIKDVPEVCGIFCATANPVLAVVAGSDQGRGVIGVIDGSSPKGVEGAEDTEKRRAFLRMIGYKR